MSYTTIIHVYPNEKIECGPELRNSWGSAPYIWDFMIKKYIDPKGSMMSDSICGHGGSLWPLWKRNDIPVHQRATLMFTYDRLYVAKRNYKRMAEDVRKFLIDFSNPEVVNHWPAIADYLESDPDIPGIGLWGTSVSDNPFNGPWNEDKEEYDNPDWENVFEVYEQIDNFGGVE